MTMRLSPLMPPPRGGACHRCGEMLEGLTRWMWITEAEAPVPIHERCTTLTEWGQAVAVGLRVPTHNETGPVGPVTFSFSYADYETSSGKDAGHDAPEDDDPFTTVEWDDEDEEYAV